MSEETTPICMFEANRSPFGAAGLVLVALLSFIIFYISFYFMFLYIDDIYNAFYPYPGLAYMSVWVSAAVLTMAVTAIYDAVEKRTAAYYAASGMIPGDQTCRSTGVWSGYLLATMVCALFVYAYEQFGVPAGGRRFYSSPAPVPTLDVVLVNNGNNLNMPVLPVFANYQIDLAGRNLSPPGDLTDITVTYRSTTVAYSSPARVTSIVSWSNTAITFFHQLTPDGITIIPAGSYSVSVRIRNGSPIDILSNFQTDLLVIIDP